MLRLNFIVSLESNIFGDAENFFCLHGGVATKAVTSLKSGITFVGENDTILKKKNKNLFYL